MFLKRHEPDDRKAAREFRALLMDAINYYALPGQKLTEHPDSFYLED